MGRHKFLSSQLLYCFYSWIAHQMEIGTTLAFLLLRSDFKFETSFGFPAQTTRGKVLDFFVKPQNRLVTLVFEKGVFLWGG